MNKKTNRHKIGLLLAGAAILLFAVSPFLSAIGSYLVAAAILLLVVGLFLIDPSWVSF